MNLEIVSPANTGILKKEKNRVHHVLLFFGQNVRSRDKTNE